MPILEFLKENGLDLPQAGRQKVRRSVKRTLVDVFGRRPGTYRVARVSKACVTGGIGWGKSTFVEIAMCYMVHWLLCLKDPQEFFGLLPSSKIAIMQMSTTREQAADVVFSEVKAMIDHAPWFNEPARGVRPNAEKEDRRRTKRLHFGRNIYIIPGDSKETTFEGYHIFGGELDEGDSHTVTKTGKVYARIGYETIWGRMFSRFKDKEGTVRGLLIVAGQRKLPRGFMEEIYQEMLRDDDAVAKSYTLWQGMDAEDQSPEMFFFDPQRRIVVDEWRPGIWKVPTDYLKDALRNPDKFMKDMAGHPMRPGMAWMKDHSKIEGLFINYAASHIGELPPVDEEGILREDFRALDSLPRVIHVDLGTTKDACGLAMGHIPQTITVDGERRFYIAFDLLMRITAPPGGEVSISGVRRIIYLLQDRGFNIVAVTLDGFASTEFLQEIRRRRITAELLSVDTNLAPYQDLHDALSEGRSEAPPLIVNMVTEGGTTEPVNIVEAELSGLIWAETASRAMKVDHGPSGSKDITDSMAGVVYGLLGNRRAQRTKTNWDCSRLDQSRLAYRPEARHGRRR